MPFHVRAALALSLPVGLIALSAGGAIVGWAPADRSAAAPASQPLAAKQQAQHFAQRQPGPSSPPAKLAAPSLEASPATAPPRKLPSAADAITAVREPYDPPSWPRQYAALPEDRAAAADAEIGQSMPIQYIAPASTASAPASESAAQQTSVPPPAAPAPTRLPQDVAAVAQQRPPAPLDLAALAPVAQQAQLRVDEAFRYARRGALYAARAELIQSLRMIAQAVDTLERSDRRSQALADGFQAMKEAEDFYVSSGTLEHDLDVEGIVLAHRTPVLKGQTLAGVSSLAALQQYYAYAQQQLSIAAAGTPAGSRALYGLGKVHMTLARESTDDRSHETPKAMAFFQSAMQADARNYLAANELGVLLAQFGQLAEAKRVLIHSVSVQSHVEGWQNLAVVHNRLGEHDLARKASYERELILARSAGKPRSDEPVIWVGPQEFNAAGGPDAMAAAPTHTRAPSGSTTRR